jgi:hypothetical protein
MLAFKESQELPEFSTVGNDNRRTRSRLHGCLPPSVRDPLMRSAAHVRSYSAVIGGAAAISDVSGGRLAISAPIISATVRKRRYQSSWIILR